MNKTIKFGDRGDAVADLQKALKYLALLVVVDGDFGPRTRAAVEEFQRGHRLAVDGIVGPDTYRALEFAVEQATTGGDTAGPQPEEHTSAIVDGWWPRARVVHAHEGRVGAPIVPEVVVLHTTDCAPGTMPVIVDKWAKVKDNGACAHFFVGKGPDDGVVQMVSTRRNGNHAGGSKQSPPGSGKWIPWHGDWYRPATKQLVHPNTIAIGIEIDNAGLLQRRGDRWVHVDSGHVFADEHVYVDARGKGWEKVTEYQLGVLDELVPALIASCVKLSPGSVVIPNGDHRDNGVAWAIVERFRVVGHATLNPNNKTDPGPQVMDWVRARY